jgi:parallel beta-helix repeat protein
LNLPSFCGRGQQHRLRRGPRTVSYLSASSNNNLTSNFAYNNEYSGFTLEAVWNNGAPHNYGAMAGVLGNISFIDYRLEFRYSDGIFQPAFLT